MAKRKESTIGVQLIVISNIPSGKIKVGRENATTRMQAIKQNLLT